jgi:adenine-specific DNA-methyltransferase
MKENRITDKDDIWKKENSYRIVATKPNTALLEKCMEQDFTGDLAIVTPSQGLVKLITTKFNRDTKTARIELAFAKSNLETYFGDHWNDIVTTGGVGQEGNVEFKNSKKPEKLVSRIIECATEENDIVLDSFLGSGTTCAVANKMRRKWIGIEMGDHIYTHCIPRINNVIDQRTPIMIQKTSQLFARKSLILKEI